MDTLMKFPTSSVKSVTSNLGKRTIQVTFTVNRNPANESAAELLALYQDKDAGKVAIEINPVQMSLPEKPAPVRPKRKWKKKNTKMGFYAMDRALREHPGYKGLASSLIWEEEADEGTWSPAFSP